MCIRDSYKGTDVLIDAIAHCIRAGLDLTAVIVGDGKYKARLMSQAERLGLSSRIRFTGQVTAGLAVRNILDTSALFVLLRKITADKVLDGLKPFVGRGRVFQSSLSKDDEKALRDVLEVPSTGVAA